MERLSTWYRNGFKWLTAHVALVRSARGKQKIYSATAHCRAGYVEALREELGEQRANEVLEREGQLRRVPRGGEAGE